MDADKFKRVCEKYADQRMTIDEIHHQLLGLLQVIHDFCSVRGICYMLHGGTLIGAIRHGGFIPWDDDADVSMPRPDYERFIREFQDSETFKLYAPEKENCGLLYGRLCEMKDTLFVSKDPWTRDSPGIGVDILPIDGVDVKNEKEFGPIVKKATKFMYRAWHCRQFGKTGQFRPRAWLRYCLRYMLQKANARAQHRFVTRTDFATANKCAQLANPSAQERELLEKSWLDEYIPIPFENREFMVPKEYDKVLTRWFGDYMTPPPVEKRVVHEANQIICWR